jgi:AAA domain
MTNSNSASTNWGYRYITAASDRFICQIEGSDALNAYPELRDQNLRADELISEFLGSEPCLFYIRRQGEARQPEYEVWELTIATDRDNFPLPTKLQERQQTLQFWANVRKNGMRCLELKRINFVELEQGQIDAFSSAWFIHLLRYDVGQDIGIPQEAFTQIATMPVCGAHVPTTEQIRAWGQYLGIERRTAEKRQFCVPFVSHNYTPSKAHITFTLNVDLGTSNGLVSLTPEEFWQRAAWARNGLVKLFENSAELGNRRRGQELGDIETVERSKNQIKIQLNSNLVDSLSSGNLELPTTGFLFFEDVGSLAQIRWKEQALANLREGHTQNLFLGEFFFDAAKARPLPATSQLSKADLLLSEANETQIAAVEAVLAAEDLVLLQGPPGTGKTTVIAEICYQVARRGGRTLVVSQANLAVDNALSRLAHHPLLRPLREGDARTRVGREGEPFLANRVIDRWLENTDADCENRLSKQQKIVQGLHPLLTSIETFHAYVKTEMDFPLNHKILREHQTNLQEIRDHQNNNLEVVRMQYEQVNVLKIELERILESNSLFLADQVKKLQQLKERQIEIASAINELREWKNSANPNLYHLLKQSLQQRLFVTEDLISLPKIGLTLVTQSQPNGLPWKETCDRLLGEINQLISQGKEWDEICQVANAIYWLLLPCKTSIANQNPSQPHIDQYGSKLRGKIESNHPLVKIRKLYKLAKNIVNQLNQSDQELYKNATLIKAIKQEYEILIDQNHPIKTEKKLNIIVADYVL